MEGGWREKNAGSVLARAHADFPATHRRAWVKPDRTAAQPSHLVLELTHRCAGLPTRWPSSPLGLYPFLAAEGHFGLSACRAEEKEGGVPSGRVEVLWERDSS